MNYKTIITSLFIICFCFTLNSNALTDTFGGLRQPVVKVAENKKDKDNDNILITNNDIIVFDINKVNIAGIVLVTSGLTLTTVGGILYFYDYFAYRVTLENVTSYEEYRQAYLTDLVLMGCGIGFVSVGLAITIVSIPLLLFKKSNKKISLKFEGGIKNKLYFSYLF